MVGVCPQPLQYAVLRSSGAGRGRGGPWIWHRGGLRRLSDLDVRSPSDADGISAAYGGPVRSHPGKFGCKSKAQAIVLWATRTSARVDQGTKRACSLGDASSKRSGHSLQIVVPLRDRCSFGRFPWLISQALSVTYMAGERRLYLERNCRLPESPAHSRRRNREGPASSKGLNSQRGFGPAVEPRRKSRPRSTSLHGSSPCKCQRLSTLRWDRLPPSRPSTKSGARAGGRRLSDRRLHRWLAGTSASAPSSHGAADLLGLNRAHICVRNPNCSISCFGDYRSGCGMD